MLAQQKEAAFTLIAALVFIALKVFLISIPKPFPPEAILFLLLMFIITVWVGRYIYRVKLKSLDEMEKTIRYQGALVAIHGFSAVVVIYSCVLYLLHRETCVVPLTQVLQLAYFSWISLYVFWSGAILVLYRTGAWNV